LLRTDVGRRHPLKVVGRFAYFQARRRLGPPTYVFGTATGTRAFVDREGEFTTITVLYYLGFPDLEENAFACHALRPGEVFWDVGANQGFWSLLLAGRGMEVHAFEPTPSTFRTLAREFEVQAPAHRGRLHAHELALAAEPGKLRFKVDQSIMNSLLKPEETYAGKIAEVRVSTVDAVAEKASAPHLLKIDVEGWTLPVLRGAARTLARDELLALVVETFRHRDGETPEVRQVETVLAGYGFHPHRYDPRTRELHPLRGLTDGHQDTIYVRPNDERLRERLRSAAPIVCLGDEI
jgi:FkbM family methyltransferase